MGTQTEYLELYKTYVESISSNESKRLQSNGAYSALLTALVSFGYTSENANVTYLTIVAMVLALIWFFTLRYHRNLATAKFAVLRHLESKFEFHPFEEEWKLYCSKSPFVTLTAIEIFAPAAVVISSGAFLAWQMYLHVFQ